ncbi:MAG: hypothetical protein LBC43_05105 [Bifidobacteriaceae bacterium]|jgi:hypothetical protein|nr:hypothetical protein [Bifidobacteriaceae bacterium]
MLTSDSKKHMDKATKFDPINTSVTVVQPDDLELNEWARNVSIDSGGKYPDMSAPPRLRVI